MRFLPSMVEVAGGHSSFIARLDASRTKNSLAIVVRKQTHRKYRQYCRDIMARSLQPYNSLFQTSIQCARGCYAKSLCRCRPAVHDGPVGCNQRSEEHTSELQSLTNLVCR